MNPLKRSGRRRASVLGLLAATVLMTPGTATASPDAQPGARTDSATEVRAYSTVRPARWAVTKPASRRAVRF